MYNSRFASFPDFTLRFAIQYLQKDKEDCGMDIGNQLRRLLDQDGITQKQLAQALNISTTTLNGYIQNRRQPDANTVIRLASYFNTTTDFIYGLTALRETVESPYNADERHLVNIYRAIPEDKKPLYVETGKTFSNFRPEEAPDETN